MAGLTLKWRNGVAYASGTINGKRIRKSLDTRDEAIALRLLRNEETRLRRIRAEEQNPLTDIYVATDGEHVKIGISKNAKARMSGLGTGSTRRISLLHIETVDGKFAAEVERKAHCRLAKYRVKGEWFSCSDRLALYAIQKAINGTVLTQREKMAFA